MNKQAMGILIVAILLILVIVVMIHFGFWRAEAQPAWITSDQRDNYFYGSAETKNAGGLPYWIWLAMPRLFPEYMPGPGGYSALGMSWEEGREMPVGFAKQRIGYIRVSGNCALCHTMSMKSGNDQAPPILAVVKGHTTDVQPLLTFYRNCAQDPRFNADEFFSEIDSDTKLSWMDKLLYRYLLIPRIRKALIANPASVLFSQELRAHANDPHSEVPLSDQHMKALEAWMQLQSQPLPQ